ncbi:MAG: hypothetical protein VB060_12605, partial [Oscillibacter sp.]|nr:hypothetical protein [Oscillibacter sp.]MEA5040799.1 hypothetical protein [Clostridiaceae bacterium]
DFARAYRAGLKGDESYSPSVLSEVEARAAMSSGRKDAAAAQQTRRARAVNAPSYGNASGPIQNGSGVRPGTGTARPFDLTGRVTGNTASPAGAENLPGLRRMAPALTAGGPGSIVETDGRFLHTGEPPSPSDHASGNSVPDDGITSDSASGGEIVSSGMAGNSPGGDSLALPDRAAAGDKPASAEDRPANEGAGKSSHYFKDEQLRTEPNTAYFWSGNSNGIGGKDFAMDHAAKNGGTTLEGLMKSQGIEMPTWDIADQSSIKAWEYASGKYAGQVSGDVHALIGTTQRQNSIWKSIELPALTKNPYVSKIILVDPETLTETVIFRR